MFSRKKREQARTVTVFSDLDVGDLVVFKPREVLPEGINDQTLTIEKVGTYDHNGILTPDFTLLHSSGLRFSATYDAEDDAIILGHKMGRSEVLSIFDEDCFADIFDVDKNHVALVPISENISGERRPWIANSYHRTVTAGIAYYYNDDRREPGISRYEDDSLPFTYFELEADNEQKSLSIEIWDDGETDVFCEITVKATVVETFLCRG